MLLGANGAGKTTLLKVLVGLMPAWRGVCCSRRDDITGCAPIGRVRRGMAYMSELGVFPGLSIDENLRIGGQFAESAALCGRGEELYGVFPDLAARKSALAGSLSGGPAQDAGHRQGAGRGAAAAGDGRALGRAVAAVRRAGDRGAGRFRDSGLAMLIAEQNVAFLDLADRVFTLEGGRIGFEGTVEALHADDALHRAYFGLG